MKISTKGRYGLKAMFELALNEEKDTPIPLKYIAEKNGLSELYLEQIFALLRKAGLVKSIRGAQGGYFLSRASDEITVGAILRVLEGPVAPSDCVIDDIEVCDEAEFCVTKSVWQRIKDSVEQVIDSVTLGDMLREHHLGIMNNKEM